MKKSNGSAPKRKAKPIYTGPVSDLLPETGIGNRIRLARISKGLRLEELAEMVGCSKAQIAKYEAGDHLMSVRRLFDIAAATGIPAVWFLEEDSGEFEEFSRSGIALVRLWNRVPSGQRTHLLQVIRQVAGEENG